MANHMSTSTSQQRGRETKVLQEIISKVFSYIIRKEYIYLKGQTALLLPLHFVFLP